MTFVQYLDLQLAAELGRCLLERNQELQNYISVLQKQIDEEQADIKVLCCCCCWVSSSF
jgi:hypothetical protein